MTIPAGTALENLNQLSSDFFGGVNSFYREDSHGTQQQAFEQGVLPGAAIGYSLIVGASSRRDAGVGCFR